MLDASVASVHFPMLAAVQAGPAIEAALTPAESGAMRPGVRISIHAGETRHGVRDVEHRPPLGEAGPPMARSAQRRSRCSRVAARHARSPRPEKIARISGDRHRAKHRPFQRRTLPAGRVGCHMEPALGRYTVA